MSQQPIDLQNLLMRQATERYRAMLITGSPGCGKTKYAKRLAEVLSARYLDLLNVFVGDSELSSKIDTFDQQKLLALLKHKANGEKILILDNLDFLINTWGDRSRREFCEWLGKLDSIQYPTVLCIFVQDDEAFMEMNYTPTSAGNSRIIRFQDLQAI